MSLQQCHIPMCLEEDSVKGMCSSTFCSEGPVTMVANWRLYILQNVRREQVYGLKEYKLCLTQHALKELVASNLPTNSWAPWWYHG